MLQERTISLNILIKKINVGESAENEIK